MNETEWVVYRLGGEHSGFLDMAKGVSWDNHVRMLEEKGVPVTLTLLVRGLTAEQARQFVLLSKEDTE